MKNLLIFTFIISLNASAENFRAPAVLDGSCNLSIPTTKMTKENGKEVLIEKSAEELQKEQCTEVRKCMNSAPDEDMPALKNLEAVACNNSMKAITIKTPSGAVDTTFDGKRKAKPLDDTKVAPEAPVNGVSK